MLRPKKCDGCGYRCVHQDDEPFCLACMKKLNGKVVDLDVATEDTVTLKNNVR